MVAEEQYDRLVGKSHQPKSLVQFFRQSPPAGIALDWKRDRDPGGDVDRGAVSCWTRIASPSWSAAIRNRACWSGWRRWMQACSA